MLPLELQWIIMFSSITILLLILFILDVTVIQNYLDKKTRRKTSFD